MRKEKMQEFSARITQANRTGLIVILYDMLEADLEYAKCLLKDGDSKGFEHECRHAVKVLNELMGSLDYHYEMSFDLLSLYSYANKALVQAMVKHDDVYFGEVMMIIARLRAAFDEVSKQDTSGTVMQNTQAIYAGLTYGRGKLNESSYDYNDTNRGFTV